MIYWYHDLRIAFLIILIILLPILVISITYDFISIIEAIQKNRRLKIIRLKYWEHNCPDCGLKNTLNEKVCSKCGAVNEFRKLVLQSLTNKQYKIEEKQIEMTVKKANLKISS
jgi:hypothetical protein